MNLREETFEILKEHFGPEKAYKIIEYIDSRIPKDIATQRDIYELKLEIEKLRSEVLTQIEKLRSEVKTETEKIQANLSTEIEKLRSEAQTETEKIQANLRKEIEKLRSEQHIDIEKIRADLKVDIEKVRSDVLKWSFGFWVTQIILLLGILLKLLT